MGNKLYVGSLPYSTTEQQLSELFAQHGTVQSAKVITDRYTGQSRGFGFVEMSTDEEAQKAIAALNGTDLGGRSLVVNEARPQEKRSYGGGNPGGGGSRDRWSRTPCGDRRRTDRGPSSLQPPAGLTIEGMWSGGPGAGIGVVSTDDYDSVIEFTAMTSAVVNHLLAG